MAEEYDWYEEIDPDELTEPYRELSATIGLKNTLKLAEKYQGMALYLPKLDGLIRRLRDEKIRKEFNGGNYRELAIKYKLTEVWIRQIVDDHPVESNQVTLFEIAK
ncbi:MAG: Mor transcription activator family protein [Bacillota bacterium]|nr:Mor transcription activator family protein [Bacillota bacterium]